MLVLLVTTVSGWVYYGRARKWAPDYDYAFFVVVMTYDYLLLASYRYHDNDRDILFTWYRMLAILIAVAIVLFMSIVVFPEYSGDSLLQALPEWTEKTAMCVEATIGHWAEGQQLPGRLELSVSGKAEWDTVWQSLMVPKSRLCTKTELKEATLQS
uniref:Uncharacterized protein n=1 Tax=Eutreptiella gymnastica TaxID=73025 RepID=A0A7S1NLC0_9EUGL|mmetsp:Transcript_52200/g.93132  ORF Transcript_52200/g.93132 Transcript_52200/m.93132 type:complete len:156 (+) Transcript_52200:162-629(+)